ncbi:beta-galactosidase [Microbacterium sp. 179-I 3D2 NHS]|uniref:beta-galactosidase n=1 Tax=Microbacterium sp. 179-I 3D2 NHS TaxID=3235178 RepID=UPI0039A3DDBC
MTIRFGGDYNPEQWPEETWDEDIRLMREAGVTTVTLGVFAWALLEPRDGDFAFAWLDDIIERLHAVGIDICLATATASIPAWLVRAHPEILPVGPGGVRVNQGSRQHFCPSSPIYRRYAARLVRAIAGRYGRHPAVALWHVNNEYGCSLPRCYCDASADAFRGWLLRRYGSIDALNAAWGTTFWSQRYGSFEEIDVPDRLVTFGNPGQLLDYDRFSSDAFIECYREEVGILRELSPDVPVTTNFMGFTRGMDYGTWAAEVDIVTDDLYVDPLDPEAMIHGAMSRDLLRSLAAGKPWFVMEQATSAVQWRERNAPKPPGAMRAWSYQAIARGADGVMFFQWRQSVAGAERFHSAMLPHAGTDTRIWREVRALGQELSGLGRLAGQSVDARVAIVMDWENWWAIDQDTNPTRIDYFETLRAWYSTLWRLGVTVDFVEPESALDGYDAVLIPTLFLASQEALDNLARAAARGASLLVTYQTGVVDENAHLHRAGALGEFGRVLGIRVEEFAPLAEGATVTITGETFASFVGSEWSEVAHVADAEVVSRFGDGFCAGGPAVTRRTHGEGAAWYVATLPDEDGRTSLLSKVLREAGVEVSDSLHRDIERVRRGAVEFVINHSSTEVDVPVVGTDILSGATGPLRLAAWDVALLHGPGDPGVPMLGG